MAGTSFMIEIPNLVSLFKIAVSMGEAPRYWGKIEG